ncbi:hypothetical protein B0H15DRAFT_783663 [Mycena belliarum]|uniref:Uncharacterized protein n=1 Tax=Mycena belliarum TaxID=1033014 RepID=A0AAD6TZ77_9AGAR|nr:hypothetical protein B0H15DRAFT_783663 [Mycena belliae]
MLSRSVWWLRTPASRFLPSGPPYTPTRTVSIAAKAAQPKVTTLDPARLRPSDHVDLSHLKRFAVLQPNRKMGKAGTYLLYHQEDTENISFPPRTAGFFYYYRPPDDLPVTAGGIRFRIAAVNPAAFSRGRDLTRPNGAVWHIALESIAKSMTKTVLREIILRDKLVSEEDMADHTPKGLDNRERAQTVIHSFYEPFPVSFQRAHYINIYSDGNKYRCDVRVFHEQRAGPPSSVYPYSGRALVRFELSTLPEHSGLRVAVLRCVKIIDPPRLMIPDYDGYLPPPVEGELVQRPSRAVSQASRPWVRDLSSGAGKFLALLLDGKAQQPGSR